MNPARINIKHHKAVTFLKKKKTSFTYNTEFRQTSALCAKVCTDVEQ